MVKPPKPSKKHHFVPQAQLRHFAQDAEHRSIWVFDKETDRSWVSSILNAGSENDFNTVILDTGKWNFEDLFQDVDSRSARLVGELIAKRSLAWMDRDDATALIDLFATQMLRTQFSRSTPRVLAGQMREIVRGMGYEPDDDPYYAMPSDTALRLGAVRTFLGRERIAPPLGRLVPALFAAPAGTKFILSDDPVVVTNAFAYGDAALEAHGVIVLLPIAPDMAVALVCPTIVSRYEAIDQVEMDEDQRSRMQAYLDGFVGGTPIVIEHEELNGWNQRQIARAARYLYAANNDFGAARKTLADNPDLRRVDTHIQMGEMGRGPPPRRGMPKGLQLVVNGRHDHCILPIKEIDRSGEGLTARTANLTLLELVAQDRADIRVELFDSGHSRQIMSAAKLERFGDPADGWFRVVHSEPALRGLMRQIDAERTLRSDR